MKASAKLHALRGADGYRFWKKSNITHHGDVSIKALTEDTIHHILSPDTTVQSAYSLEHRALLFFVMCIFACQISEYYGGSFLAAYAFYVFESNMNGSLPSETHI